MPESLTPAAVLSAMPPEGLFRRTEGDRLPWLASPRPLSLSKRQTRALLSLGYVLAKFYDVCGDLYHASAKGKIAPWISEWLDAGKPGWLIDLQRSPALRNAAPRVIRPDLMLKEEGFGLTELDSVPGGMGVTHWLSHLYASRGWDVLGGADGMKEGFLSILPRGADILVSRESADYRPEMSYLARILGDGYEVRDAEDYAGLPLEESGRGVYRFFELFDLPHIPGAEALLRKTAEYDAVTPPAKPHFEEKLWLALFHTPGLRSLWKTRLRESHLERLDSLIPRSWALDPSPLPPRASLPWLNLNSWEEVAGLSQKKRELVVKISGFHELAWGARGVYMGHDLPSEEWRAVLENALSEFSSSPWLMQEFTAGSPVRHPYFDPLTGEVREMEGLVRLCPYFFRSTGGDTRFGGCLATIVPRDKKKIHGMKDAILVPCVEE